MNDPFTRVTVWYSGQVQGVGFRYTARNLATGFDLSGAVRNLSDGRVELVAEGVRDELDAFRKAIRDSGLGSLIRDESDRWERPAGGLHGFQIVP